MSGHKRVKNIDYDDYEYDDFADEPIPDSAVSENSDNFTEDDREQLRIGTINVRKALPETSHIPDEMIHEALWHYWFDVEKTVIYFKNEIKPTVQKVQPKAVSKFDQAVNAAASVMPTNPNSGRSHFFDIPSCRMRLGHTLHTGESASQPRFLDSMACKSSTSQVGNGSTRDFTPFKDISWSIIPEQSRQATFTAVVPRPHLALRGGSGKPSKLAALAASRRLAEPKKEDSQIRTNSPQSNTSPSAISLLDKLSLKETKPWSASSPSLASRLGSAKRQREEESKSSMTATTISRDKRDGSSSESPQKEPRLTAEEALQEQPQLTTQASAFASALCGKHSITHQVDILSSMSETLHMTNLREENGFSGPSPDDIVTQAQAKGKQSHHKKQHSKDHEVVSHITKHVHDLKIDHGKKSVPSTPPKIKSKQLNVREEYEKSKSKNELNFVVVGHIDHGKSTLMGRLLFEHGMIDQRTLDKNRKEAAKIGKESFALAWVMDAREDEREYGVTIDYAEKTFETEKTKFTIIDAPGHKDFVANMIAGASMADFALLVVDAGSNNFEAGLKGQTKEHADIIRCMKLEKLIIAVNKMDSVSWSQSVFESIKSQTIDFLSKALFNPENLIFIPCSGLAGDNIISNPSNEAAKWYKGSPTLSQALDDISPNKSQYLGSLSDPFRLRIAAYTGLSDLSNDTSAPSTFTIHGRIDAGTIQVGDRICIQPSGETATIRGIIRGGGIEVVDWAVAGQIVGLQLVGCDEERIERGDLVCHAEPNSEIAKNGKKWRMKVLAFDTLFPMPVDLHRGRLRVSARIVEVLETLDPKTNAVIKKDAKLIKYGQIARVVVEVVPGQGEVPLERPFRMVMRYGGQTVGAAAVEAIIE